MLLVFLMMYVKTTKCSRGRFWIVGLFVWVFFLFYVGRYILDFHISTCLSPFLLKDGTPPISWNTRCKIVQGTANGINFLHENNHIHRDIKR